MIRIDDSVLSGRGEEVVREYVENGQVIARGEGRLRTYEDYLVNRLGYDLTDPTVQEWRTVKDYPLYEVSDLGLFRNKITGDYLAPTPKTGDNSKASWRMRIIFSDGNGGRRVLKAHQVVMDAFVGEMPKDEFGNDLYVVSHENDIPMDNRLVNLKYRPRGENIDLMGLNRDLKSGRLDLELILSVYRYVKGMYTETWNYLMPETEEGICDDMVRLVREEFGISKGTLKSIYRYEMDGDGLLVDLELDSDGCLYRPTDSRI